MADPGFPRRGWDGGALTPEFGPKPIITARKRSLGQGNIFAPVCNSVHMGGTWAGTPRDQVHPQTRYTTQTRYTPQGPGAQPGTRYTPNQVPSGPGTPLPPDQVHPSGTRYIPQTRCPLGPGTPPPPDQVHPPD